MPNVIEMLGKIRCETCIASSGPLEKIYQALQVSGLSTYFDDRIFSSYEVGSWKPEPKLFQHAATAMGYAPEQCVVVEDSLVGMEAAVAAKILALHYRPNKACPLFPGVTSLSDMSDLPKLMDSFRA